MDTLIQIPALTTRLDDRRDVLLLYLSGGPFGGCNRHWRTAIVFNPSTALLDSSLLEYDPPYLLNWGRCLFSALASRNYEQLDTLPTWVYLDTSSPGRSLSPRGRLRDGPSTSIMIHDTRTVHCPSF